MRNLDTVLVPKADLAQLEMAFLVLWRFVHPLHADLERGADICPHLPAMKTALDKALQDWIDWTVAKRAWDTRRLP